MPVQPSDLMTQPKTRRCPFARNSSLRDTERNRSLLKRKTAEKPKFNNSALALIELCQTIKGVIQENQIHALLMRQADRLIQLKFVDSRASLGGPDFSCAVNQDLAHQTRSHSEEMRAILPVRRFLPDHAQVRFMNQSCTLKALPGGFTTKMTSRQAPQLVIHERDQLFQGSVISVSPPDQQFTYVWMRNCAVISHSQESPRCRGSTMCEKDSAAHSASQRHWADSDYVHEADSPPDLKASEVFSPISNGAPYTDEWITIRITVPVKWAEDRDSCRGSCGSHRPCCNKLVSSSKPR